MKILAITPAYNEERSIAGVINNIKAAKPDLDILVIDDGSVDQTSELAEKTKKATVVILPNNLGIGGAVQTGFKYAQKHDYEILVRVDGDGQHRAEEIENVLRPVLAGEVDVVIGSRFLKGGGPYPDIIRRIGIGIISFLTSLISGQKITDATSGFRCYNRQAINILNKYYPADYPEPEEIIFLKKNKFRIKEAEVSVKKREEGNTSLTKIRSIYYMIKVVLSIFISSLRAPVIKKR